MAHPGGKSSRVLTSRNGRNVKQTISKSSSSRTLPVSSSRVVVPAPMRALVMPAKPNVVMKKPSAKVLTAKMNTGKMAVPPRRHVTKIPVSEELDIGRRAQMNKLTALEMRSVSVEVRNQYQHYHQRFESFCKDHGLQWPPGDQCDAVLADFLDLSFLEGRSAAEGEKVVAAVEFMNIGLRGKLVRCKRALKGWRREMPAGSRLPLPRLLAAGMAMKLMAAGHRLMALKLMADCDTYVRPGESIGLKGRDVVRPVPGGGPQYQWFAIVIRDQEDLRADKTGVFDNSIPFNSAHREYLGELLWAQSMTLKNPANNLYPFTADQYRKKFVEAGASLGVPGLHPYQTRHGGASEDLNRKERDAMTVKARGRWMTDQSLRRYGKVGKIQQLLAKLSPSDLAFCQWSNENMEAVLRGLKAPRSR